MKILYIAYHYAPYNCVAAVRSAKVTKYLRQRGHDVQVLTAGDQLLPDDLDVEIQQGKIIYADWININKPFELLAGGRSEIAKERSYLSSRQKKNTFIKFLVKLYKSMVYFPDSYIGWIPKAKKEAESLFEEWKPDVIYASGGPFSAFILASALHKKYDIPWVAEYRDLWAGGHNYNYGRLRLLLERQLEKWIISSAEEFVTVSDALAKELRSRTDKKVHVITNGYDPDDRQNVNEPTETYSSEKLNIVYTGQIYIDNQTLTPLFDALAKNKELRRNVVVHFYGPNLREKIERKYDAEKISQIQKNLNFYGLVSRKRAMQAQEKADLLLLLGWSDENFGGILTGKLFEYLSAKRNILAINSFLDDASKVVEKNNVGHFCSNSEEVAKYLQQKIDFKSEHGFTTSPSGSAALKYQYSSLAKEVESVLTDIS